MYENCNEAYVNNRGGWTEMSHPTLNKIQISPITFRKELFIHNIFMHLYIQYKPPESLSLISLAFRKLKALPMFEHSVKYTASFDEVYVCFVSWSSWFNVFRPHVYSEENVNVRLLKN